MADTDFDRHPHGHCPKHCAECGEDAKATLCPRCSDLAKADMCIRCRTEPALPCTLMCDGCWTKAQQLLTTLVQSID